MNLERENMYTMLYFPSILMWIHNFRADYKIAFNMGKKSLEKLDLHLGYIYPTRSHFNSIKSISVSNKWYSTTWNIYKYKEHVP